MRTLPESFDPSVVSAIDERLDGVERDHGVRIPWAIESGSRAWGFPSPDSDYDCRYFFVRPVDAYWGLWPARDVIETPLDAVLDVNGWDLAKALRLAVAGNAVVGEWLRSPIVYRGEEPFRDELLATLEQVVDPARLRRHHLHVGRDQWKLAHQGSGVKLKKVFYAVRPALTLRWLDDHAGIPPIDIDELLQAVEVPQPVLAELHELRAAKARTRELGTADLPPAIGGWVESVLEREDDTLGEAAPHTREQADEAFQTLVRRWGPPAGD